MLAERLVFFESCASWFLQRFPNNPALAVPRDTVSGTISTIRFSSRDEVFPSVHQRISIMRCLSVQFVVLTKREMLPLPSAVQIQIGSPFRYYLSTTFSVTSGPKVWPRLSDPSHRSDFSLWGRMVIDFILLLICHLTVVLALPVTSLPSASLPITHRNNSTQQKAKHAAEYVKHNRIFRQTEALSPKLIVGFKLEGDPKSILESER